MLSLKTFFSYLKIAYASFLFLFRPKSRAAIYILGDSFDGLMSQDLASNLLFRDPKKRPLDAAVLKDIDTSDLQNYPAGSLGNEYGKLIQNFSLKGYGEIQKNSSGDIALSVRQRIRKTHDLWHLVTDFKFSEHEELGLQAFCFAQYTNLLSAYLIALSLFKVIIKRDYSQVEKIFEVVVRGYQMGRSAKDLIVEDWQLLLEVDLHEVRKRLNINLPTFKKLN